MDFLALDFETANEQDISACEIGIAVVRNYKIVESKSWLIRPPRMQFNAFNSKLHGIKESDVKDERNFQELWTELQLYFTDELLIAHNAALACAGDVIEPFERDFRPLHLANQRRVGERVEEGERFEVDAVGVTGKEQRVRLDRIEHCRRGALRDVDVNGAEMLGQDGGR